MKPNDLIEAALKSDPKQDVLVDTGDGNYRKIATATANGGPLVIRLQAAAQDEPPDEGGNNP